jgi:hypothetical protein
LRTFLFHVAALIIEVLNSIDTDDRAAHVRKLLERALSPLTKRRRAEVARPPRPAFAMCEAGISRARVLDGHLHEIKPVDIVLLNPPEFFLSCGANQKRLQRRAQRGFPVNAARHWLQIKRVAPGIARVSLLRQIDVHLPSLGKEILPGVDLKSEPACQQAERED